MPSEMIEGSKCTFCGGINGSVVDRDRNPIPGREVFCVCKEAIKHDAEVQELHQELQSELHGSRFGRDRCPRCRDARASIMVSFAVDGVEVSVRRVCPTCFIAMYDQFAEVPKNA